MGDNVYLEVRQRAKELMRQAYLVWRSSDYSEHLEHLVDDPVFEMLMAAMAYEFKAIDSNMEMVKQELIRDFADVFLPNNVDRVLPTTVVVENQAAEGVAEVLLDDGSVFRERSSDLQFIPLLKTRVLRSEVSRIERLDGRRWMVSIAFPEGVTRLDGFTFAIKDLMFRDFSLSVDECELSLVKPWNQYDLPFTEAFSYAVRMYNKTQIWDVMSVCLDLLAEQDVFLFSIADPTSKITFAEGTKMLNFVVEFKGIDEDFVFDKNKLHLNVNVLVNAKVKEVTLTEDRPIAKVPGVRDEKFLYLLPPATDQIRSSASVEVRRVEGDRFNSDSLLKLLDCLVMKFRSDYYAFSLLKQQDGDMIVHSIESLLNKLRNEGLGGRNERSDDVYVFRRNEGEKFFGGEVSTDIRYLSTNGALADGVLRGDVFFAAPAGLEVAEVRAVSEPVIGTDNRRDGADYGLLTAYYVKTSDRLVTLSDIKLFVLQSLMERLSLTRECFSEISVVRQRAEGSPVGYEICVTVRLVDSTLVRKAVGDRIARLECLIEKLIEVRNVNIYPIRVKITF